MKKQRKCSSGKLLSGREFYSGKGITISFRE
jgi:hypothetical protein